MSDSAVVRARAQWIALYQTTGDAGLVCRRCGISRPTLRKWLERFQANGEAGLAARSRRPHRSPRTKLTADLEQLVLSLRATRQLGPKLLQAELWRLHGYRLSTATIWKVLHRHHRPPLYRRPRSTRGKRYSRPIPGDRVQLDTFKVCPGCYQFTAVDDCSRFRVLGLYPRRAARYAVEFLVHRVVEEMPFPIQAVQTDRGSEFFALEFQRTLAKLAIRFRPIPPRSPHLNGKVERSQQTDWREFYATVDVRDPTLSVRLEEWQFFANWHRPHSSLNGRTPIDRICELADQTPSTESVCRAYELFPEPIRERHYWVDQKLRKLKRCL